ncbi:hypothetical protein OROMI_027135 [Orobanche minor]
MSIMEAMKMVRKSIFYGTYYSKCSGEIYVFMDRAAKGRRGGGRGAGRNPGPRINTRANTRDQHSSAGSDTANSARESTRSPASQVSLSGSQTRDSVQQEGIHVDPLMVMQGMMAQMTQILNLTQNQQAPPPSSQERDVSTIINDISRQRPPSFEGSSEPAYIIHWFDHFEKLFTMVECPEGHKVSVAAYYLVRALILGGNPLSPPTDRSIGRN